MTDLNTGINNLEVQELLNRLTALPTDLEAIEKLLIEKQYNSNVVSEAGYYYANACWNESDNYYDERFSGNVYIQPRFVPNMISAQMPKVFELLLRYGLNPDTVCNGESLMSCVSNVFNEYTAADTLALLLNNGGNPLLCVDGESFFKSFEFDIVFGAFNQEIRGKFDSWVHCWFVLLGYIGNQLDGKELVTVFPNMCEYDGVKEFEIGDLKNHRDYFFGITKTPWRGENWSLHIFSRRTGFEVARL